MFDARGTWYINTASQNIKGGTGSDGSQNSDFKIGIWRCTRGNLYRQVNWDTCPESIYVNIDSAPISGFRYPFGGLRKSAYSRNWRFFSFMAILTLSLSFNPSIRGINARPKLFRRTGIDDPVNSDFTFIVWH
jgi:hypothetical protein